MNKTLRWLIALISASLMSYTLFASLQLYIGDISYDNPPNRSSISIDFMPIHKREQTHTVRENIVPPHDKNYNHKIYNHKNHHNSREQQTHDSKPAQLPPKPTSISINKHSATDRENRISLGLHPIFRIEPIYPLFAIKRNIEGWVEIEFLIAENGTVINPKVVGSEPSEVFEQTALIAVSQWQYRPGHEGKSSVLFKFELRDH